MRIAFTILLNGINHLKHNEYYKTILNIFDKWVIVEGVAKNGGSTSWCNELPYNIHNNFLSNDGTSEFIDHLAQDTNYKSKIQIIRNTNRFWNSKDDQVNAAVEYIKTITGNCKLWQIDIDEQWSLDQIIKAEQELDKHEGKTGCFLCNYYVGKHQVVHGDWGEGRLEPYRRLWNWTGEKFITHEPPKLEGNNNPRFLLTPKFNHYSYFFEEDVKFKELYYSNYIGLYERWLNVQNNKGTLPIRALLGNNLWWSNTNTIISYTE